MVNRINTNISGTNWTRVLSIATTPLATLLLVITTIGTGQATPTKASNSASAVDLQVLSTSVASDNAGSIYYVDTAHSQVYRVSSAGAQTQVQCCVGLASGLNKPRGVALDGQDNLYIADTGNNRIVEIDSSSQASVVNVGLYGLLRPSGLTVDANDDLYIADSGNNRIIEVAATGAQASLVDTADYPLSNPSSVSIDQHNTLYITDTGHNRIVVVPASGSPYALFSNQLHAPLSMTVDGDGNAYIAQNDTDVPSYQNGSKGTGEIPAVVSSFSAMNLNVTGGGGSKGSVATASVNLTPLGGFSGTVYLSVVGLPPNVIMQLTHPVVSFQGTGPVAEQLQVGESSEAQQSRLTIEGNRSGISRNHLIGIGLAGLLPLSLLTLIGFRASSRKLAGACKFFGILTLLLLLPAITTTASGCAGGYPAGLFGNATYTATLIATPANGKPYSLGSFAITTSN